MRSTYKKVSGMTAEIKIRRCYGCGSLLQSQDRFETGFVSKKREGNDEGLCDRCFDLRHPSQGTNQTLDYDFAQLLMKARDKGALFCYVFDSFSFDASIVLGLSDYIGKNILAIFTKRDILPNTLQDDVIIEKFKARLAAIGINPVGILLVSAYQSFNFDEFFSAIEHYRNGKDVFFVGASQVGKSTLINNFLMNYDNETGRNITSERIGTEGLTLTKIPLDKDSTLFDTPGIFNPTSILNQVERRTLKYIIPHVAVSAVEDNLKSGESMFLGALARIDNKGPSPLNFKLYFARDVIRTKTKIERADVEFTTLCGSGEGKPSSATVKSISDLEKNIVEIREGEDCVVSIYGYGKLVFNKPNSATLEIYVPKGVTVETHINSAWLEF